MATAKFEKQRDKIIESSSKVFLSKGYNLTTINDILAVTGIAKGTLYHYFESKDEIFDAELSALEKFKLIFTRPKESVEKELSDQLVQKDDLTMHIRSYIGVAERLGPLIADIIKQGIAEGVFQTNYPLDFAEYVIISQIMVDEEFFKRSPEELKHKVEFIIDLMERYLNAPQGSFDFLYAAFGH